MNWVLSVVQGASLADGLEPRRALTEPLGRFTLGRDPACDWPFADRTKAISARHCEIVDSPHGPLLRDLSTNGTFVNGATVRMAHDHVLRDGDRIEIGPYVISVAGPPMPPRPAGPTAVTQMAPARAAGVTDTAPAARGGDPAAMWAAGGAADAPRLTEILRAARPRDDAAVELTKIRTAPARAPAAARAADTPAPVAPPSPPPIAAPVVAPKPAAPEPDLLLPTIASPPTTLAQALARGLEVPESALQGLDLLVVAEQLAAAAEALSRALRGRDGTPPLLALAHKPGAAPEALEFALRQRLAGEERAR